MRQTLATILVLCAALAQAQLLESLLYGPENVEEASRKTPQELVVRGEYMSASRATGELVASGRVEAVASPYRFRADSISRSADGFYKLSGNTLMTTCTNDDSCLHWCLSGEFAYREQHSATVRDAWVRLWDIPVLWHSRAVGAVLVLSAEHRLRLPVHAGLHVALGRLHPHRIRL